MYKKPLIYLSVALSLAAAVPSAGQPPKSAEDYLSWMQENLPECPEFDQWQKETGSMPPDFAALPSRNLLPDPFTFANGTPVPNTDKGWADRREEIKELFQKYVTGYFPPKPKIDRVELLEETVSGDCKTMNVRLHFGPQGKGSVRASITIPAGAKGEKFPVLLSPSLGGLGNSLIRRGYISAGFAGSDFMDDGAPLKELYPDYNFATLPRRAWLASIVLDWFETIPEVDMEKVSIYGYSRDGKMALIAAAFDTRFAGLLAGSTGVGGVVPWRYAGERGGGESIESTTRMFPTWFIPELRYFSGKEDKLPVDANLLLALTAPRAVLMEWGYNDEVANGWAQERAYDAALPVYKRFGAEDKLGILAVPGFHGSNDMEACLDFLDIQFGRSDAKWQYNSSFAWDYKAWSKHRVAIVPQTYPRHNVDEPLARDIKEWEAKSTKVVEAVKDMLGKTPSEQGVAARSGGFFGFGGPRRGPIEMLEGPYNAGQLKPDVSAWVIARKSFEFGWTAEDGAVASSRRISFGPNSVSADLYYPKDSPEDKKLPTVIWLHGFHYPLGYMWVYRRDIHPILALVKEGYAVLAFDQTGFGQRFGEYSPFYNRYPQWSRMGMMVQDVSNAVTALTKEKMVDADNISVLGYTMGGTVGLYAAALDERISNVVSVCGFTPMRSDTADKGMSGMTRYSHLYGMLPKLGYFDGQEDRLPYDFEDLIALTAPRGVLIVQPNMDRDADPEDVRRAVGKAQKIFEWKGAGSQLELKEPDDYGRMSGMTQINIIKWLKEHTKQ